MGAGLGWKIEGLQVPNEIEDLLNNSSIESDYEVTDDENEDDENEEDAVSFSDDNGDLFQPAYYFSLNKLLC